MSSVGSGSLLCRVIDPRPISFLECCKRNQLYYWMDRDLPSGQSYPPFEQLGPGIFSSCVYNLLVSILLCRTITRDDLVEYINKHYSAPRMVLAAAGGISCILLSLMPVVVLDCLNEIFTHNLTNPLHTCTAIYSNSSTQPDRGTFWDLSFIILRIIILV